MLGLKKRFSVWVVSPTDGKVRKLSLTRARVLGVIALAAIVSGGVAYLAGDYTRVKREGARGVAQSLRYERSSIRSLRRELASDANGLQGDIERVKRYESEVRERLHELSQILNSAAKLGVVEKKTLEELESNTLTSMGGVGGAELPCLFGDAECGAQELWRSGDAEEMLNADDESLTSSNLVEVLEGYIRILKTVPFARPVEGGRISSTFGWRRSPFSRSNRVRFHEGLDLSLPTGSRVYATADGVVKEVKYHGTYGIMVDLEHQKGVVTRYAHLSRATVKKGEEVRRGEEIARSGNTGRSTGPHLHYEVRVYDRARDPMKLIELGKELSKIANS